MEAIYLALGTTAALLFTASKVVGIKGIAKHAAKIDVIGSLLAFFIFAGTSTMGIAAAMWTGLFLAAATTSIKMLWGQAADAGKVEPANMPKEVWEQRKDFVANAVTRVNDELKRRQASVVDSPSTRH